MTQPLDAEQIISDFNLVEEDKSDANEIKTGEQSLLSRILSCYEKLPIPWRERAIRTLIEKGAFVIKGDCPIAVALALPQAYRQYQVRLMLNDMIRVGKVDENPLFLLARRDPPMLISLINEMQVKPRDDFEAGMKAWLLEYDNQGNTVGHHLWSENSQLNRWAKSSGKTMNGTEKAIWSGRMACAWHIQFTLNIMGGRMDQANDQGASVMDLCIERITEGLIPLYPLLPTCMLVDIEMGRRKLEAGTRLATGTSRAIARL